MPNNSCKLIIGSALILDDSILNADVNSAAGIAFSKLLCSAIDAALVPDGDHTRSGGTAPKRFDEFHIYKLFIDTFNQTFTPSADGTLDIGDSTHNVASVFVNAIEGAAKAQILVNGLVGGLV